MTNQTSTTKEKKPMTLSTKILIGLFSGIALGLFLGEYAGHLEIVGDAFIGLLQMTVLPYIVFSLIVNIGRLSLEEGRKLITQGIKFLSLLLAIGIAVVMILPFAFPEWKSANFFSTSFVTPPPEVDFLKLYIPSNPFFSLAESKVPAVVLFSILVGIGVMQINGKDKEILLNSLDAFNKALNQVNKLVVKLTPAGVFAIAASTAGTMTLDELGKMQAYLLTYLVAVLILTFWVLPMLITACTPFKYKDVFKFTKATLITIFATGKIIVVLPQLIEDLKSLYAEYNLDTDENKAGTDILMPLAYPFPNLGTLAIFVFVPFAAWFVGNPITISNTPMFIGATLLSSFVAPVTGIPFMLDLLEIPKDMFQLFVVSTVFTDRVRVVLGAMHLITLTILTLSSTNGFFKLRKRKITMGVAVTVILFIVTLVPLRLFLSYSLKDVYQNDKVIANMQLIHKLVPFKVLPSASPNPTKLLKYESILERIKRRGIVRVGFYEDEIPFSYFNARGELVGFGIDMAHELGSALDVEIEFVPITVGHMPEELKNDNFDIVMSDIFMSSQYSAELSFSKPYLDVTMALVVRDQADQYKTFDKASEVSSFTIGYFERKDVAQKFLNYFPQAKAVRLDSVNQFFNQTDSLKLDGLLTSAERGAALTLLHPEYQIANPLPYKITLPLAYPVGNKDENMANFVTNWIEVNKKDGTITRFYDYWILGNDHLRKEEHWSVIKDVLHWVD
ncbi:cation:dicarboxylase symporter family transporter [Flammeovirga pectinis]|uniref:Cation:dicarboxylase symporter family transporter n=1 Tax=Flammeovirga pectinis TaxID=2494373 RepID=A0A3S9P550_9BACT|nr:cation:dicarboxylase symporter family transporter [Flammeovirga pectinis]AZQ63339.1 cation:dicarboxylase symporter family transporter [Flammeovirga pectinis]